MLTWAIVIQILAIIVLMIELLYVISRKPSYYQTQLVILSFAGIVAMGGYIIEIVAQDLDTALAGVVMGYVGKPYMLLASLLFVLTYCGYKIPKMFTAVVSIYMAIFPVLIATNYFHHLYYSKVSFVESDRISPLVLEHGPLYYLYMATVVADILACIIFTLIEFRKCKTRQGKVQAMYVFGMSFCGILGYVIFLLNITNGYDSTMLGCLAGSLCLFILFFKYKLFDTLTLAKDRALLEMSQGLLVVDSRGKIAYENIMIYGLLKDTATLEEIMAMPDGRSTVHKNGKVYDVNKQNIESAGRNYGTTVEVTDITVMYNYSTQLEHDVKERTKKIKDMQRDVLSGFANIVEARDGTTGNHIKRTSEYVRIISEGLKESKVYPEILTEDYIERLVDVAPLHDIGKIGISDTILLKPGRLTPEEFDIMKHHTTMGAEIIEENLRGMEEDEYVSMAEEVALFHHEKWDGSGYPKGLSGEDIPLSARIMALADVYDALRSARPYKNEFTREEALGIIFKDSAKHFDPEVVKVFMNNIDRVTEIEEGLKNG